MKRNTNLVPFSHDHHLGLLAVWKLRQGIKKNATTNRMGQYIEWLWQEHLADHFRLEEELLPPLPDNTLLEQMLREHVEIKGMISNIAAQPGIENITSFANLLEHHIRFEERELFPHYETMLTAEQLTHIGNALNTEHQTKPDDFSDEFWK